VDVFLKHNKLLMFLIIFWKKKMFNLN